jgi:hypothetical protein
VTRWILHSCPAFHADSNRCGIRVAVLLVANFLVAALLRRMYFRVLVHVLRDLAFP